MKKNIALVIVCMINILLLSACTSTESQTPPTDITQEGQNQETQKAQADAEEVLYTLVGEHRDETDVTVIGENLVFPKGVITKVEGGTPGTTIHEGDLNELRLSEEEIAALIYSLETDATVAMDAEMLKMPPHVWDEGYGYLYITLKTASQEEMSVVLSFFGASDLVFGQASNCEFLVDSKGFAGKLRDLVLFQIVALETLEQAVLANATSIYEPTKSITLEKEDLDLLIHGIQTAEKLPAGVRVGKAVSIEILLENGERIHTKFAVGDSGKEWAALIAVEAEVYEMSGEFARPLWDIFEKAGMAMFPQDVEGW